MLDRRLEVEDTMTNHSVRVRMRVLLGIEMRAQLVHA
jgi:hypothetical protein